MKNFKRLLSILLLIFSINTTLAQFGQGGQGGGFGGQQNGRGQGGGFDQIGQGQRDDKPSEESEKSKKERLDKEVAKIKEELKLDELQIIGVQMVLADNQKKQAILFKKEIPQDEKIIEIVALSESTDRKIIEFLSKDQKSKYKDLTADRKAKMQELLERNAR